MATPSTLHNPQWLLHSHFCNLYLLFGPSKTRPSSSSLSSFIFHFPSADWTSPWIPFLPGTSHGYSLEWTPFFVWKFSNKENRILKLDTPKTHLEQSYFMYASYPRMDYFEADNDIDTISFYLQIFQSTHTHTHI